MIQPSSQLAFWAGRADHVELLVNQYPQVLLLSGAPSLLSSQPVFVIGIACSKVQDLALGLAESHESHSPPLRLELSLWMTSFPSSVPTVPPS